MEMGNGASGFFFCADARLGEFLYISCASALLIVSPFMGEKRSQYLSGD